MWNVLPRVSRRLIAVTLALVLGYAKRNARTRVRLSVDVSGLGYAIPGAIIAVIVPLAWLDHRLIGVVRLLSGEEMGLLLSGTIVALLFAYTVRFLAVPSGPCRQVWRRSSRT